MIFYIKDSLTYKLRANLAGSSEFFESVFIEIETRFNRNVIAGLIYRPPGLNLPRFSDKIDTLLEKLSHENKLCYLLGDFNINLLNYEAHNLTNEFINILYSHFPLISSHH